MADPSMLAEPMSAAPSRTPDSDSTRFTVDAEKRELNEASEAKEV